MSNITAHAQDVQLKLTDALSAIQACMTAVQSAKAAIQGSEGNAGNALLLMNDALVAMDPFPQRLTDMINGIVDADHA